MNRILIVSLAVLAAVACQKETEVANPTKETEALQAASEPLTFADADDLRDALSQIADADDDINTKAAVLGLPATPRN